MRTVGSGKFVYKEIKGWGKFPDGWKDHDISGVAVDSRDRVYAFARNAAGGCVLVFSSEGRFLNIWGEGLFKRSHGIFIDHHDDQVFCVDDWGQTVFKFTQNGELLQKIETSIRTEETGYIWDHLESVVHSWPPFCYPTNAATSPEGEIYVSDGYGNARVHKFTCDGRLLLSWGTPGQGPGQFAIPHSVRVDAAGLVYVSDRMNSRIEIFSPQGEFIAEWQDVRRPDDLCFTAEGYVCIAELGYTIQGEGGEWHPVGDAIPPRITVRDPSGKILAEWGEEDPHGAGLFFAPHGIAINSRGDLFISEVQEGYSGYRVRMPHPGLHKYERINP